MDTNVHSMVAVRVLECAMQLPFLSKNNIDKIIICVVSQLIDPTEKLCAASRYHFINKCISSNFDSCYCISQWISRSRT